MAGGNGRGGGEDSKFGVGEGKKGGSPLKHCWAHDIRDGGAYGVMTAHEEHKKRTGGYYTAKRMGTE